MRSPERCPLPRLLPAALVLLAVGCGGPGKPVKVEGVVTLDGAPLAGATVTFAPVSGGRPASGRTDADGSFRLTTFSTDDGALPGEYKVIVVAEQDPESKFVGRDPETFTNEEKMKARMAMAPKGKKEATAAAKKKTSSVPSVYSDVNKTPLKEVVPTAGKVQLALRSGAR